MDQFPPNSRKSASDRPEPRKIEPVTQAKRTEPKRGLGRKFKQAFIGGDAKTAGLYVVSDVVLPTLRDMLYDAVDAGFRSLIYGDSKPQRRGPGGGPNLGGYSDTPRVNYQGVSSPTRANTQTRMLSRQARARHSLDDLVISSRQAGEEVLDRMYDILSQEGFVSVADLYELTDIRSEHTDMKWGWTNLRGSKLVRMRQGGFMMDLPEPQPLR